MEVANGDGVSGVVYVTEDGIERDKQQREREANTQTQADGWFGVTLSKCRLLVDIRNFLLAGITSPSTSNFR